VVGESATTANLSTHAFLYDHGTMIDLGGLKPGWGSAAFSINSRGDIVGTSNTNNTTPHAFIYRDGVMTDLNDLLPSGSGWTLEVARGINDSGQVVGWGTINGEEHAFLLDVQAAPEPSSLVLAVSAALGVLGRRRRAGRGRTGA
jgi:probable HAF family extracellular repeat protein